MADAVLEVRGLQKAFGSFLAVNNVSFALERGTFVSLLGPSGSGKTTILRLIAGFERPGAGTVLLDGESITDRPPFERNVTTVFQHYALFPHMNVFDNIAFGLHCRGSLGLEEIRHKVQDILSLVQMQGFETRSVRGLSGGEQQRVALARALVTSPSVLLLDEPLGALDLKLRRQMGIELKTLHRQIGMTFLYVTHDQEEALSMSDRVIVIHKGMVRQDGSPTDLYWHPKSAFVADFIGEANLLSAELLAVDGGVARVRLADGVTSLVKTSDSGVEASPRFKLALRGELVVLGEEAGKKSNQFFGTVEDVRFYGGLQELVVNIGGNLRLRIRRAATADSSNGGDRVLVGWDPGDAVLVTAE